MSITDYISENIIRLEVSRRGGGIEIDASKWLGHDEVKLTAYQNYLGGGMLGAIQSDCNLKDWHSTPLSDAIYEMSEALKQYFYQLSNEEVDNYDEWASTDNYLQQQARPASAY